MSSNFKVYIFITCILFFFNACKENEKSSPIQVIDQQPEIPKVDYHDFRVEENGLIATVTTPYSFYYNGNFSHCGVNSFQLVNFSGEWKIVYLIDTRTKENCD